jgi:hypothetical protein
MIAGFGSGAAYSVVSGITQGNPFQAAFTTGVLFAAFQGALHKVTCMLGMITSPEHPRNLYESPRLQTTNFKSEGG